MLCEKSKQSEALVDRCALFYTYFKQLVSLGAGWTATGTFWNLYSHLFLKRVFPALKLIQNCYLHYNINILFENWHYNHKLALPLLSHMSYRKTILTIWQNVKARRLQKSRFANSLVNWKIFGSVA